MAPRLWWEPCTLSEAQCVKLLRPPAIAFSAIIVPGAPATVPSLSLVTAKFIVVVTVTGAVAVTDAVFMNVTVTDTHAAAAKATFTVFVLYPCIFHAN